MDTATSDRFPSCSSLLLNGKVNFSKVNVILGHMIVSSAISKFNLSQMTINEHANVGLPHVILFNKIAFYSIM